jgi:uncharacterized protein YecT (DUF1311 family)
MKTLTVFGIFLSVLAITSKAQQKKQPEDTCCCTTYDTGQCLIKVKASVDTDLDNTYQKALKRWSEPELNAALRKAQNAWVGYRDANCDAELATYGRGTMGPNMWAFCRIRLTRQRIAEITNVYLSEH